MARGSVDVFAALAKAGEAQEDPGGVKGHQVKAGSQR